MQNEKEKLFETVYFLITGQYNIDVLEGTAKMMSEFIKDEVWNSGGSCYKYRKKISELSALMRNLEDEHGNNDPDYNPCENLTYFLNDVFEDYCQGLCEVIFNYGLEIGTFSQKMLNDIF